MSGHRTKKRAVRKLNQKIEPAFDFSGYTNCGQLRSSPSKFDAECIKLSWTKVRVNAEKDDTKPKKMVETGAIKLRFEFCDETLETMGWAIGETMLRYGFNDEKGTIAVWSVNEGEGGYVLTQRGTDSKRGACFDATVEEQHKCRYKEKPRHCLLFETFNAQGVIEIWPEE